MFMTKLQKMSEHDFKEYKTQQLAAFTYKNPMGSKVISSLPPIIGVAKDDAKDCGLFLMFDLIHGKHRVAFSHITFIRNVINEIIKKHGDEQGVFALMIDRVAITEKLSEMRNVRLMKRHNINLKELGLHQFKYAETFSCNEKELFAKAILHNIDPLAYFDEKDDDAEIIGTSYTDKSKLSESYCYTQNRRKDLANNNIIVAGDNVVVFIDALGQIYIFGIERKNAPGIKSVAHAGGFADIISGKLEDVIAAAKREGEEEVEHNVSELGITDTTHVEEKLYEFWDFRAFGYNGAIIGAEVNITYFSIPINKDALF